MKKVVYPIAALALFAGLTSCEEDNPFGNLDQWEQELAKEYISTEAAINDIYSLVDDIMRDSSFAVNDSAVIRGATVTRSGSTISIDYGLGAAGSDGRMRTGTIMLIENGDYFTSSGEISANFQDFSVEGKKYNGSLAVTNLGSNTYELSAGKFSIDDRIQLDGAQNIAWLSGFETWNDIKDDAYQVSGTVTGADTGSRKITAAIDGGEPLSIDRSCKYKVLSGIVDLDITSDSTQTGGMLDFRSADGCQNLVDITLYKEESEISVLHQFEGF